MDIVTKAAQALWQVVFLGLLLGAGLPALFALGIRSLETRRTVVLAGGPDDEATKPSAAGMAGAVVCFGVCVLAVIAGIVIIIFGKRLFGG